MDAYQAPQLQALADPTRQQIVRQLRNGPLTVQALADILPVTRPAVSAHLRVLSEAGLVSFSSRGTRHYYALRAEGVATLRAWLDDLWSDALKAFADYADRDEETTR